MRPLKAILTTHTALLDIEIDIAARKVVARTIDRGKGIYFGITRAGGGFLVSARNLDMKQNVRDPAIGTNLIYRLDQRLGHLTPLLGHPMLFDLHQIRAWGRTLFIILGRGSTLAAFDISTTSLMRSLELGPSVPRRIPRHPPINGDAFHMNSISFTRDRMLVLAHNWDQPSFALEFMLPRIGGGGKLRLAAVHRDLGHMSHDVVLDKGNLYVLDGQEAHLIVRRIGGTERRAPLGAGHGSRPFPRGLSLTQGHILIGCGDFAGERVDRETGPTRLVALDRHSLEIVMDVTVGTYGNPTGILCVSEPDLSDQRPSFLRALPRKVVRRHKHHRSA